MSLFDDIIQRGFNEMAKAKQRKEQREQDIVDGEFVELPDDELMVDEMAEIFEDSGIEEPIDGQDGTEDELMDRVDSLEENAAGSPEASVEEVVQKDDSAMEKRPSISNEELVFGEDISEQEKAALRVIAAMPESTLDEVTAKALTYVNYKNPNLNQPKDEMGIWASHLVLQQFHEGFDKDGGIAWRLNESEHPLAGWSDVVAQSLKDGSYDGNLVHKVDMEKFGLSDEKKAVLFLDGVSKSDEKEKKPEPERTAPEPPDFVKGKKWNEKLYGKGDKKFIYLYGKKKFLSQEQQAQLNDYLTEKELFEKGMNIYEEKSSDSEKPSEQPEEKKENLFEHMTDESAGPNIISDEKDWEDGYSDMYGGYRTMDDNGMVSYEGVLGKFQYDATQFQLQVIQVDADDFGNPATSYPVLKYIGPEVEGRYIQIPEGLEDGSFMFDGNENLQSMPKLPKSLKIGFGMFKDCKSLESAGALTLPPKMTDGQFMFSGCTKLLRGPAVIPGTLKDATGMFANCKSMGNTPKILPGVECCDSMFANCESLTKKPKIPQSVQYADYATYGCDGIDAAEKQAAKAATEKKEKRFEKQLDKKSFGDRLGSLLSACMQVHAMQKSGHNMFHAMFMTYQFRKAGAFTRDMAGGWAALYKADRSGFNQFMMMSTRNNAAERNKRQGERKGSEMQSFQHTNSDMKQSSKQDRQMYANGARAMAGNYFEKVAKHGYPAQKTNREAVVMDAKELESLMKTRDEAGNLNAKAKTYYAKKALELVSNQAAYYKGAQSALNPENQAAAKGLSKVSNTNMKVLADKIQSLQDTYQFMNERQFKSVCHMMEQTSYGKTDEYKAFKTAIMQDMKSRAQFSAAEQKESLNTYRRKDYTQTHGVRVEEAERRFGFTDSQSVHAQKTDDSQFQN